MIPTRRPPRRRAACKSLTTPIFGGTKEGVDPDAQYHKDIAKLRRLQSATGVPEVQDVRSRRRAERDEDSTPTPRYGPQ